MSNKRSIKRAMHDSQPTRAEWERRARMLAHRLDQTNAAWERARDVIEEQRKELVDLRARLALVEGASAGVADGAGTSDPSSEAAKSDPHGQPPDPVGGVVAPHRTAVFARDPLDPGPSPMEVPEPLPARPKRIYPSGAQKRKAAAERAKARGEVAP